MKIKEVFISRAALAQARDPQALVHEILRSLAKDKALHYYAGREPIECLSNRDGQ